MAKITISDLRPAELEENSLLTALSLEETSTISGGGPLGKLIGGIVGGIVGGILGAAGGPVGIIAGVGAGVSAGSNLGDSIEEVF